MHHSELEILMIKTIARYFYGVHEQGHALKPSYLLVTCNPNNGLNLFDVEDFYTCISQTITAVHVHVHVCVDENLQNGRKSI